MQLILAEFCGRWGCSWWEKIINLILGSLGTTGIITYFGLILLPIILIVLVVLTVFTQIFLFFYRLVERKENITNADSSKEIEEQILSAGISVGKFVGTRGIKFLDRKLKERKATPDQSDEHNVIR